MRGRPATYVQAEFTGRVVNRPFDTSDRDWAFFVSHTMGAEYKEIGISHGITPGRVRQICEYTARKMRHAEKFHVWEPNSNTYLKPSDELKQRMVNAGYQL